MYEFDITRPATVGEAVAALGAEDAQALAGGQTLIPTLKQRLASPSILVSLSQINELKGIRQVGGRLVIGAGTTHGTIAKEAGAYPALAGLAAQIGDPAVRSRGTIGGSLANNDPSACYPAAALASGACIVTNKREIDADSFFQGLFATALEEGELITEVNFPIPAKAAYVKFAQPASRFALVGVFVAKFTDRGPRLAVTGASENGVFRWFEAEAALAMAFSGDALDRLSIGASDVITDLHGSGAYRAHLVKVLAQRALAAAR